MELTPRLRAIADQVPQDARLADIGTDHGYLPVWLVLNGRTGGAIAADLRSGPLERARETARQYGVEDQIDFRLGDGLGPVAPGEVDTIVIAGMGGETIAAILEAAPWAREGKLLLLQPMTAFPELRKWLQENGYAIGHEVLASEGKRLYSILYVRGGRAEQMSPAELWAGRQSDDPLRGAWLELLLGKVNRALEGHRAAARREEGVIAELETVAAGLERMRKEIGS